MRIEKAFQSLGYRPLTGVELTNVSCIGAPPIAEGGHIFQTRYTDVPRVPRPVHRRIEGDLQVPWLPAGFRAR